MGSEEEEHPAGNEGTPGEHDESLGSQATVVPGAGSPSDASAGATPTVQGADLSTDELEAIERSYGDARTVEIEERKAERAEAHKPGDTVGGHYEIVEPGRRGGMGVVYKARDTRLGRTVAIKRILTTERASKVGEARFLKEAAAIASLNHFNIVTIHAIEQDELGHFIVMEWVDGGSLREHIRNQPEGKLSVEETKTLAKGIGQALAYAHRKGVIHRDVKPANILLSDDGVPKLVDFGLARMASESELSKSGYGLGTLDYMPPEQRRDAKNVDHRADVYAFGATLYEMVSGRTPRTVRESEIPPGLRLPILKAMEEQREKRYFAIGDMLTDVEKAGSARAAAAKASEVGACPECGHSNPTDVRYCEKCGAGLMAKCPKCKTEIRVWVEHCGSCGVNISKYRDLLDHLARADDYLKEHKYARAEKELVATLEAMPDEKEAERRLRNVREQMAEIERLRTEVVAHLERKEYVGASVVCQELESLLPGDEQTATWRRQAQEGEAAVETAIASSKAKLKDGLLQDALAVLEQPLCGGALDDRRRAEITKVRKALELDSRLETALRKRWLGFTGWRKVGRTTRALLKFSPHHARAARALRTAQARALMWIAAYVVVCVAVVALALGVRSGIQAAVRRAAGARLLASLEAGGWTTRTETVRVATDSGVAQREIVYYVSPPPLLMEFVYAPAGEFKMGRAPNEEGDDDELPQHDVEIREPFLMSATEVTQRQWKALMGGNPSRFEGDDLPVESVEWRDAARFCKEASEQFGLEVRLPTEAEWEYACRAGTTTPYYYGAEARDLGEHAWYGGNSSGSTQWVGNKTANAWGLYDMHGNVWEWCSSLYRDYPFDESKTEDMDASGVRVVRGGSWLNAPRYCRSAARYRYSPDDTTHDVGLRVVVLIR